MEQVGTMATQNTDSMLIVAKRRGQMQNRFFQAVYDVKLYAAPYSPQSTIARYRRYF
jgi:hypothetical protein